MRVLIAGCGYVGAELARRLVAAGDSVWGLKRNPGDLPTGVNPVAADLTDATTLHGVPSDLDAVVYCPSAGHSSDEAYRRVYVEGLTNLCGLSAIQSARPRLLFVSSTSVYGQDDDSWITEASPTEPLRFSGKRTLEAEQIALSSKLPSLILRCGGIYGPGRRRLIEAVRTGSASFDPARPTFTNRIHRDDVAGALLHLMRLPAPESIYLGVDCLPASREEVLTWLAEKLHAPLPKAAPALASDREAGSKRCSNARLLATGYRFSFPTFREGYAPELT
jgi:nucleoside-diphosphate-sugar epimerase